MAGYHDGGEDHLYDQGLPPVPPPHEPNPHKVVRERSTYMSDPDAEKFCQLFCEGLDSGAGYARILTIMERQGIEPKLVKLLRRAILEKGDRLGQAFARMGILDATARQLILVAEEQGTTPTVFKLLARNYGKRFKNKMKVVYGMVYPMLLVALGFIMVPDVFKNITRLAQEDDWQAQFLQIVGKSGLKCLIFFAFYAGLAYIWTHLPVDMSLRDTMHRLWMRVPVLSDPSRDQALANFARFLRHSLSGGMNVFQSLELAADSSNHPEVRSRMPEILDRVEHGQSLCQALSCIRSLPPEILDHIGIGEETGRLEERLEFISGKYQEQAEEKFDRLMNAVVYTLYVFILVMVLINARTAVIQGLLGDNGTLF